jgi:chemotaxis methyl-accepting protein methylase
MDDREFSRLLEFLGLSWQGYRKVRQGVKKRVGRHMLALGCRSLGEYLELLQQSVEARRHCDLALTVPISRFFRDRRLWEFIENRILPELISAGRGRVKAWSAGCACGEEPYSLKILWERLGRAPGAFPILDVTATDLNPLHLERAAAAVYPPSSLREVPEAVRAACFDAAPGGARFTLKLHLGTGIAWRRHDLLAPPPGSDFDLILARNNLLTYYRKERAVPALAAIVHSLAPGGYLVVGSREKLPSPPAALALSPVLPFAFRKTA